jgi:hypothetical protein
MAPAMQHQLLMTVRWFAVSHEGDKNTVRPFFFSRSKGTTMPPTQGERLKELSKAARKEFGRRGYQLFEKPVKQLFDYDAQGNLVVNPLAHHNTAILADMALRTRMCGMVVSLEQSLRMSNGASLYYNAGCKLVLVVKFEGGSSSLVAFAIIMNLKEDCLESRHRNALHRAGVALPRGGVWLELICAEPGHKGANLIFLYLLKYLSSKTCILNNPTTAHSKGVFFTRYGFGELLPGSQQLAILTPSEAYRMRDAYYSMLPGYTETMRLCTRGGVRDRSKTYWDCGN